MTYRTFDTGTWSDPFVESLSPNAKLLFVYLWTNKEVSQCGIYSISRARVEFETGLRISDELIREISPKVEVDFDKKTVWVKNFFRRQCQNPKFIIGALKCMEGVEKNLQAKWVKYNAGVFEKYPMDLSKYGINTVCIPYAYPIEEKQPELGEKTQTEENQGVGIPYRYGTDTVCLSEQNREDKNREDKNRKETGDTPPDSLKIKKTKGFAQRIESKYLDIILSRCEQVDKMPQKNGTKFNVYQLVQMATNESRHPQAIIDGLDGLLKTWKTVANPFTYGRKIITANSGNYHEQEHTKETEQFREIWCENPEILKLVRSIGNSKGGTIGNNQNQK